ncbi:S1 family peptidase [Microlunatus soli]|uniref:S1 family peptidase n=1 Tax=Microlunatus soli TaxID=630515 RepID=UPI001E36758F|nr:S1 family peptidase [Microlunatus soli]
MDRAVERLGPARTGGGYIDDNGTPVVTTTAAGRQTAVRSGGVTVRVVDHSLQELRRARASLDKYAKARGAGQVQEWHIDVVANRLLVASADSDDAVTRSFLRHARSLGDAVQVETVESSIRPAGRSLYNSDNISLNNTLECSVGFNATDSQNRQIFLTAGHCLNGSSAAYRGTFVGSPSVSRYPNSDFGAVRTDTSVWTPEPAVNKYDGKARAVLGTAQPAVGSEVCKSSSRSGWTCGTIQAYGQTVNYGGGNIVYDLVRFSACVEPGDSGGAVMDGSSAVGLISGAQFYTTGNGREICGSRVGQPNVSFYQPIRPALKALDAKLLTYPYKSTD